VDDVTGVVTRIRTRATTISNWDRKEYVIPNKEFITGRVLNWTLTDQVNRIVIEVGIAYGSDVEAAKEVLYDICKNHPKIISEPSTNITFERFADSSLILTVRTFVPDVDSRLTVIDQLHTAINDAFKEAGIEIAFPQHDLHIRSMDREVANVFTNHQASNRS
jgi:potassium efflux system protein